MKNGDWIVRARVTSEVEIYCSDCTEAEAKESPYDHSHDEQDIQQIDYEVLSVEENI